MSFAQNYRPGETRQCIVLNAIGDALIEDIVFSDVRVRYGGGGTAEEAARAVPPIAGEYFEIGTPPAYGLFARNVRGLTLANVRFDVQERDLRPAALLENVTDVAMNGFSAQGNAEAKAVVRLVDTRDVLLTGSRVTSPATAFVSVEGAGSRNVTIEGGDLSKAARAVTFAAGASQDAVTLRS
jgi:hypothetical protein